MECDAFIGTRNSNWNALIDVSFRLTAELDYAADRSINQQLRCVWLNKCKNTFVEVGTAESWNEYWW